MIPRPGTSFAGYRILAECGRGAFGRVFLAEDTLGRRVALKYLFSPDAGEAELKGLRNYISVTAVAPALLNILHCDLDDGNLFYAMELADNAAESPGRSHAFCVSLPCLSAHTFDRSSQTACRSRRASSREHPKQ